jgi:NAD(P)-dependent dehydrogenase (short-subunit alcohol dehydrogenase family)
MQDLRGKVAVITGAASGIGRALAVRLAAEGMRLVLADVEATPLEDALAEVGADAVGRVTDVSKAAELEALRDVTVDAFGTAHLVVNNAGVSASAPIWTFAEDAWQWILGVNLWGVIHGIRAFVPLLVDQGEGHVVNTSSMQGLAPTAGGGPYAVSKHAVVALSDVLLQDLRAAGSAVGVSVLCPGPVQTRIYDSDRNRPDGVALPGGRSPDRVKAFLEAKGVTPDVVAGDVVDAVRADRFYILTDRSRIDDVTERARRIAE